MADYDCDWCDKEKTCKYAWQESDCYANKIQMAKEIVSVPMFDGFFKHIDNMYNSDDYFGEPLDNLHSYLRWCKSLSEED